MSKGLVIAMRAIPGSGKSTFVKQILQNFEDEGKKVLVVSADKFFYDLGKGEYKFDFKLLPQAHGSCFRLFIEALQEQSHDVVIVDNTNLRAQEIAPYRAGADAYDYDFVIKEVKADQETAFKRNQHGIPAAGHRNMFSIMNKEDLPPWWKKEVYRESPKSNKDNPQFSQVEYTNLGLLKDEEREEAERLEAIERNKFSSKIEKRKSFQQ